MIKGKNKDKNIFIRSPLFLQNQPKVPKLKSFNIKTNYGCYTKYIWEFVANVNDLHSLLGTDSFFTFKN